MEADHDKRTVVVRTASPLPQARSWTTDFCVGGKSERAAAVPDGRARMLLFCRNSLLCFEPVSADTAVIVLVRGKITPETICIYTPMKPP